MLWTRLGGNRISLDVPGKQLFNAVDGVFGDALQDRSKVEFGIESVELSASDQGVYGRCPAATGISTGEEVVAPSEGDSAQRTLGAGVVDLNKPVLEIVCQGPPSRECIADSRRSIGLDGQGGELLLEPSMEIIDERPGSGLSDLLSSIHLLASDLTLDAVECTDAIERFSGYRGWMCLVDVVQLATRMSHAGGFLDVASLIKMPEARVRVGLKHSAEVLQMLAGMFAFTIGRVGEPDCRRSIDPSRPIIANIGPQYASGQRHPFAAFDCVLNSEHG